MGQKEIRSYRAGKAMADSIIEFIHLMYNKVTARRVLLSLVNRLQERRKEFDD